MRFLFGLLMGMATLLPVTSVAAQYEVNSSSSLVTFTSKYPLKIKGRTNKVSGKILGDLSKLDSITASFSVELATLRTGIKKRDRTMRRKCLETDKFPLVSFNLDSVLSRSGDLNEQNVIDTTVAGIFSLHGIKRKESLSLRVTLDPKTGSLHIESTFPLELEDYGIFRPRILFMKFANVVDVTLDLVLNQTQAATSE